MCVAEKTNCWGCVRRVHKLGSNSTLDGLTGGEKTHLSYILHALPENTNKPKAAHVKNDISDPQHTRADRRSRVWVWVRIQTFCVPPEQPVSPSLKHERWARWSEVHQPQLSGADKKSCFREMIECLWPAFSPLWPQTENSDPLRRPWVNSNRRRRRRPVNGLHHSREGGPPNTAFIPSHLMRRSHVGFSFLRRSISCKTFKRLCKWKIPH